MEQNNKCTSVNGQRFAIGYYCARSYFRLATTSFPFNVLDTLDGSVNVLGLRIP